MYERVLSPTDGGERVAAATGHALAELGEAESEAALRSVRTRAAEAGVDLIVMGAHGRNGLEHYLGGSVAERVVEEADDPVMTVSAPA